MTRTIPSVLAIIVCGLVGGCSSGKRQAEEARAEAVKAREDLETVRAENVRLRAELERFKSKSAAGGAKPVEGGAMKVDPKQTPVAANVTPADYTSLLALMKALPEDRKPSVVMAEQRQDAVGQWFAKNADKKIVRLRAIYSQGQRDSGRNIMTFWESKEDLGLPGAIVLPTVIFSPRIDQEDELKALRPGTERTVQGQLIMVDVRPSGQKGKYLLEIRLGYAEFADR